MEIISVKKSRISGKGTFAEVDFKKHQFVAFVTGKLKYQKIHSAADSNTNPNWIGIKKYYWIDPETPFRYINHSCDPNVGIRGTKSVYALKPIKKGDEITMDYSTTEVDELWWLTKNCQCKSSICRKAVGSVTTLSPSIFSKYLPYIPTYMKEYYRQSKRTKK